MTPRSVVVTMADGEPGRAIGRVLAAAGDRVSASVEEAIAEGGCVDALVNCYQLDVRTTGGLEELEPNAFLRDVADHLSDAFFTAQAAAAQMLSQRCPHATEQRRGCIVNLTSVAGVVALPGQAAFCASMAALTAASKVLAVEWAPRGIRVASVGAGLTPELLAGTYALPGASRRVSPATLLDPERVAETVRFVLSEAGAGIAGVPVYVDGGWLSDGYWEALV